LFTDEIEDYNSTEVMRDFARSLETQLAVRESAYRDEYSRRLQLQETAEQYRLVTLKQDAEILELKERAIQAEYFRDLAHESNAPLKKRAEQAEQQLKAAMAKIATLEQEAEDLGYELREESERSTEG
jgi:uncharacterized protein YdbL (DUF1318 family)